MRTTRCYLLFFILHIDSTCVGHYYAHHQEHTTIVLITTLVVSFLGCCTLEVRCGQAGVVSGLQSCYSTQERDDQCANQHYIRELLIMGIVMPETF